MKITESEFRELLEKTKVPVVADFYADWCGPCRAFGPTFEAAGKRMAPEFAFCKINIDEATALCQEVDVRVVPTIMVFRENRKIAEHEGGFASEKDLEKFIRTTISNK